MCNKVYLHPCVLPTRDAGYVNSTAGSMTMRRPSNMNEKTRQEMSYHENGDKKRRIKYFQSMDTAACINVEQRNSPCS